MTSTSSLPMTPWYLARTTPLPSTTKTQGIEVYTIGAGVSSSAASFLQSCATDASHFYNATDTVSLTAAFQSITQKLTTLHLTH